MSAPGNPASLGQKKEGVIELSVDFDGDAALSRDHKRMSVWSDLLQILSGDGSLDHTFVVDSSQLDAGAQPTASADAVSSTSDMPAAAAPSAYKVSFLLRPTSDALLRSSRAWPTRKRSRVFL